MDHPYIQRVVSEKFWMVKFWSNLSIFSSIKIQYICQHTSTDQYTLINRLFYTIVAIARADELEWFLAYSYSSILQLDCFNRIFNWSMYAYITAIYLFTAVTGYSHISIWHTQKAWICLKMSELQSFPL